MYTLRIIEANGNALKKHVYLGESYETHADPEKGVVCRVTGRSNVVPEHGIAINEDDYAFIMSANGSTFETLNRPIQKNV